MLKKFVLIMVGIILELKIEIEKSHPSAHTPLFDHYISWILKLAFFSNPSGYLLQLSFDLKKAHF